jgi:RimJ/RimL family protein N-acetyltransferase
VTPGPTIETERLVLRPTSAQDFDAWAVAMEDPETCRFIGGVQPRALAWRGLLMMAGAWALQGFAMFSVIEKASGRWVGRVGPWQPEGWPGPEVGYTIARPAWGKGYAPEAAAAAMDWAFESLGWTQIIHAIHPDNLASRRVAAKLGAVNRGPGRLPAPFDQSPVDLWGQSRADWRARRAVVSQGNAG